MSLRQISRIVIPHLIKRAPAEALCIGCAPGRFAELTIGHNLPRVRVAIIFAQNVLALVGSRVSWEAGIAFVEENLVAPTNLRGAPLAGVIAGVGGFNADQRWRETIGIPLALILSRHFH